MSHLYSISLMIVILSIILFKLFHGNSIALRLQFELLTSQAVAHLIEINDLGEEVIGHGDDYDPY